MSPAPDAKGPLQFGYTAVGHVTIDVMEDGSSQPGGTAFYGALQASRLGRRSLIVTQGVPGEIQDLLEPYTRELDLLIIPAAETTTLQTFGWGAERKQRVLAWAGPMPADLEIDTEVLHLAPVAREVPAAWAGRAAFVGLTPQGLIRRWREPRGEISLLAPGSTEAAPRLEALARRCDAIVLSQHERPGCGPLIEAAVAAGAVIAVTDGPRPATLLHADSSSEELEVPAIPEPGEDLGAGDVFAAAFFLALAEGRSPREAGVWANAAAAVRMHGHGAQAIGDTAAIESRIHATAGGSP
jgi:sugar/nucleoside kinase (ribokinase family)